MTLLRKLKYKDIVVSLMGNGIDALTFMINGKKVRVEMVKLFRDLISDYDTTKLKSVGQFDNYMKALCRLVTETDGRPYGYRCDSMYLIHERHIHLEFIEFSEAHPFILAIIESHRREGMYMNYDMGTHIIKWHVMNQTARGISTAMEGALAYTRQYSEAVSKSITDAGKNLVRKASAMSEALDRITTNYSKPYINVVGKKYSPYVTLDGKKCIDRSSGDNRVTVLNKYASGKKTVEGTFNDYFAKLGMKLANSDGSDE